ncbi:MAG TPA: GYD domain-containing protein [Streptosporangiaceae bacterium]|nr:GYD domain-containing protein [Streptosporangiaceae bacterium]HUL26017.1 GYD domain-containing protein [Streptosporangiaceae bacterium]
MALYMYQAAYTPESLAAQIKEPQDRIEAVRPSLEALGGTILAAGYPFGDYDVLVIYEAADDTVAASFAMAVAAGGAVRSGRTTRLLDGREWVESLRKAQGSTYRPAR